MKSYKEFILESKKGVYVAYKVDPKTAEKLKQYCIDNDIPNYLEASKDYHCTVIYSRKWEDIKLVQLEIVAKPLSFDIFNNSLVLKINNVNLTDLHSELMEIYNLTYDFDEYIPHVTLSYDCGDIDIDKLPKINFDIVLDEVYKEDL